MSCEYPSLQMAMAAGILLIEEAGGVVTDFQGKSVDAGYKTLVAGGPAVQKQLIECIKNIV